MTQLDGHAPGMGVGTVTTGETPPAGEGAVHDSGAGDKGAGHARVPGATAVEGDCEPEDALDSARSLPAHGVVRRTAVLAVAFGLVALAHWGPLLPGLHPVGQTVLGVFIWFILCTAANALPGTAVGVGAPMLVVVLTGMKLPKAFSAFNGNVFFLAFGAFVMAAVMMATPLGRRVALGITGLLRSSKVDRILGGAMGATVFLHAVLPTVSETALFLPVAQGLTELPYRDDDRHAEERSRVAVIMTVAGLTPLFAASLFLTGAFPNLMLTGVLASTSGIHIGWLTWFVYNLPLWGLLPLLFFLVRWWFHLGGLELADASVALPRMRSELGPMGWNEKWAVICVTGGFVLWVSAPLTKLSTGMVALMVVMALFAPWGGLDIRSVGRHVMWEVWVLLGGAISMGNTLYGTGVVSWLAKFLVKPIVASGINQPIVILLIVVFGLHIARAGIVSAVATGAAFIPLTIGLAKALGMAVLPFSLIVTNALGYAIFLPISITAVLIAFSASGMRWGEALRFGALLSVVANVYVVVVQSAWLDLLGLPLR